MMSRLQQILFFLFGQMVDFACILLYNYLVYEVGDFFVWCEISKQSVYALI